MPEGAHIQEVENWGAALDALRQIDLSKVDDDLLSQAYAEVNRYISGARSPQRLRDDLQSLLDADSPQISVPTGKFISALVSLINKSTA